MLGNGRAECYCYDGVTRLGHIRGKMRKKVWVSAGDIVLVGKRDYQDDKASERAALNRCRRGARTVFFFVVCTFLPVRMNAWMDGWIIRTTNQTSRVTDAVVVLGQFFFCGMCLFALADECMDGCVWLCSFLSPGR